MSYLLTEIALDMLGYKFYNINGDYEITDFQNMFVNKPAEPHEPPLQDIIYPNGKRRISIAKSIDSVECIEVPDLPIPNIVVNQDQMVMSNIKESIDREIESLREEIYSNKTKFIEDKIKLIKKRDKNGKITPQDILKPYNAREKKNIHSEADMLVEFLSSVEQRLEEANSELFKQHKKFRMEEYLN